PTAASAPTPRSLPTTPRHPPPPKTPCSGHPAPCRCPDPSPPTPMASTSASHHPPAPDHTRPAAGPDKPTAAPSAMTSTPYQPSSPGLGAPDNTRYDPSARSTGCRSLSTWSSFRASECHSRYPSSPRTRQFDSLSTAPVVSPHAPVPPTPLPAAVAAAGPSPAPPAARCQRTPHQNSLPRRRNRLPAPSPRPRVPTGATPPGSTGSATPPLQDRQVALRARQTSRRPAAHPPYCNGFRRRRRVHRAPALHANKTPTQLQLLQQQPRHRSRRRIIKGHRRRQLGPHPLRQPAV